MVLEVAAFGAATVMAAHLTPIALATHEIVLSVAAYTYMVPLGISAAAAVAVGHAIGAGNPGRARRAGILAIALGAGLSMAVMAIVLLVLIPQPIIRIWTNDSRVLILGAHVLAIVAGFQIFDGVQTVSTGALRGLGETRFPMLMNFAGYWILGLPFGALLCFYFKWGLSGLWTGLTVSLILIALVLIARWLSDSRKLLAA